MSQISLIALDLDGTLLNSEKRSPLAIEQPSLLHRPKVSRWF